MSNVETWKKEFKEYVDELYLQNDDYKGIMFFIDDVDHIIKEQQWIPCSKRLPKAGKNVLISMDDYNVTVGRIVKIGKTKMWQIDGAEYSIDSFAAWMPLPLPYKR